jgi:hypothetical protein
MSFEPFSDPSAPDAAKTRRFGRVPRAAMAGGLAVGLALGGAGIAFAASSTSTSTPSTTAPAKGNPPGPGHGGPMRRGGGLGGFGDVVHGQFTTRTSSGGYQTVAVQVGKIATVSSTAISVTSTDGYSHSYTVTASTVVDAQRDGIGSVAVGDQVRVVATTKGSQDTATNVVDTTKIGASRQGFGFGRPQNGRARPAPPAAA